MERGQAIQGGKNMKSIKWEQVFAFGWSKECAKGNSGKKNGQRWRGFSSSKAETLSMSGPGTR